MLIPSRSFLLIRVVYRSGDTLGLEGACELASSRLRTPRSPAFVGRFGTCARDHAECTRRELQGQ
eukprot:7884927-Alexandrium_andersonii.AAC.1